MFATGYKKSVRTCRAHHISGIGKHLKENELRNKYPTLSYIPCGVQQGLYLCGYTNRMSVALFLPLFVKFCRFRYVGKSKKRILEPRISPLGCYKISARREKKQIYLYFFRAATYLQIAQQTKITI